MSGRFSKARQIGKGAYSVVYGAFDTQLGREVAVKEFGPAADPAMLPREAAILTGLQGQPGVVQILGTVAPKRQIVLELCEGPTFRHGLMGRPPDWIRAAMRLVARGSAALHAQSGYHADLSIDNLMFLGSATNPTACEQLARVIDFGSARILGQHAPPQAGFGSNASPETQQQNFGPHVDVYATGAVLGQLLLGQHFDGAGVRARLTDNLIPVALRPLMLAMLDPTPANRPTMAHVASQL